MLDSRPVVAAVWLKVVCSRPSGADQLREGVQVGRLELRHLAPLLDGRDDLVLVADRLEHARIRREAGLAAPLARQAELLEQDRRELLRGADRELLPGQVPDAPLQLHRALVEARADRAQPLDVERDADTLHLDEHVDQRQLDLVEEVGQPVLLEPHALALGQQPRQHRALRNTVRAVLGGSTRLGQVRPVPFHPCAQAGLGRELVERVAPPGGVDQVRRDHRVVLQRRRRAGVVGHRDRLPVVRNDRLLAARHRERRQGLGLRDEHLVAGPGGHGERPARAGVEVERALSRAAGRFDRGHRDLLLHGLRGGLLLGRELRVGILGRCGRGLVGVLSGPQRGDRDQLPLERAELGQRHLARGHLDHLVHPLGWRRAVLAERLLETLQRGAQLELPERLAQLRPVRLAREHLVEVDLHLDVAHGGRQLLRDAGVVGVLGQVLLALGARDRVDVGQHAVEVAPLLEQLRSGLVADAGHARDVVRGVALEPVEVGDPLGRDAVAVDHGVAVVDRRVGDPAARGHDPDARLHELEHVSVAGHDRHVDPVRRRARGQRGDHVVGLVAGHLHVRVAERVDQRVHVGPLLGEQVGALAAAGLVLPVDLVAARRARVPHDQRRLDAVLGDDLHEHRGEAEDRVRRLPLGRRDRLGEGEEGAVDEAVPVDQEQLTGRIGGHEG